jgi:hypothetical protein
MTRHHHAIFPSLSRRLRPSPVSVAAAAAAHDPGLLLQLQATHDGRAVSAPAPHRGHGSDLEQHRSSLAIGSPCPAS